MPPYRSDHVCPAGSAADGDESAGDRVRLFDNLGEESAGLEVVAVVDAPGLTHLRYRVVR